MPPTRDQAICARAWEWSETSQTVLLFTHDHGLIRLLAKGARRDRAPFSGGVEPLTAGEAIFFLKHSQALDQLTAWTLRDPFPGLRRVWPAFAAGHLIAETLAASVGEHDPHPELFVAALDALHALDAAPAANPRPAVARAAADFLIALHESTGSRPALLHNAAEPPPASALAFDPTTGALLPAPPPAQGNSQAQADARRWLLRPDTANYLINGFDHPDPPRPTSPDAPARAARLLATWWQYRAGRPLRTFSVFEAALAADPPGPSASAP